MCSDRNRLVRATLRSAVTENRYGNVYFDGVCTDTSNAALPVDEVRRAVEPEFEPPWDEPAVHVGLTAVHRGTVVRDGDGFVVPDDREAVAELCAELRPRVRDGDENDAAAFVAFVRDVVDALTEEV